MFKTSILSLFVMTVSSISSYALTVDHLRVQSLRNPNGIDVLSPQFSWQLHSDERNVVQTAYQLMIFNDANDAQPIYDSGMVESSESAHVTIKDLPLQPATRYHWQVTVCDNKGGKATSTEKVCFDTGLLGSGWSNAKWIQYSDYASGLTPESSIFTAAKSKLIKA